MDDKNLKDLIPPEIRKQKAVALRYDLGESAPKVVASGQAYVAEKIVERAIDNEVPIYQDSALVEDLMRLDLGDDIPPELYEVVAQVLIYVSDLDKKEGYRRGVQKF